VRRLAFALVLVPLAALASCEDNYVVPQPCTNIPDGGCPISHGVACEDPACESVYACRENDVWELQMRCPGRDGGGPTDAFVADAPPASFDANADAPPGAFGGPGCSPLIEPDCALGIALSCGAGCCGCEDLFVCENGGWEFWGTCGDGGVQQMPPDP
jgi:hypothetical protein